MEYSISEIISIIGLFSAGIWFYWTQKFRPRVEFDIDCEFFTPSETCDDLIAEIRLTLTNKGYVQHTLNKLELSVHGLSNAQDIETKDKTHDVIFNEPIFKRQTIIPTDWYYWVRPGVNQTITKLIKINKQQSIIRVTSGFTYKKGVGTLKLLEKRGQYPFSWYFVSIGSMYLASWSEHAKKTKIFLTKYSYSCDC